MAIYVVFLQFNLDYMLTDEFYNTHIIYKILYMSIAIFVFRFKYYSAWSLGMLGMNATGITYNVHKDQHNTVEKWDRIDVSDVWTF